MATAGGKRDGRLKSWKEIAAFFGTDERTVRRWQERGLPVRRVPGGSRPTVYAEVEELEAWLQSGGSRGSASADAAPEAMPVRPALGRRAVLIGSAAAALSVTTFALLYWPARQAEPLSPAAKQLLDRGVEASRLGTAESTSDAAGLLQEAVRLAPRSEPAWGALAIAYAKSEHFLDDREAGLVMQRARAAAARALELDAKSVGGHAALALLVPTFRNWLPAERRLREVLALDDSQFDVRLALSWLLTNVGRTREALALVEPMARAEPLHPILQYWFGFLLWQAGRLDESDAVLEQGIRRWPRHYTLWFTRFWQLVYSGRPADALAMSAASSLRPIGIPAWNFELIELSARAVLTRSAGDIERALAANAAAARRGIGFLENEMEIAAHLGALDTAFEAADSYLLESAGGSSRYGLQQGSYTRPDARQTKLLFSPSTKPMRSDARFAALVRRIGLAAYWRDSRSAPDVGLPGRIRD